MAEDLTTMLTDGAQTTEDEQRLAGNTQDAIVVDPNASSDNPGGSTPTGGATDNTGTEMAPDSQPPAVNVTADIPGPSTYDTGGSGDVVIPPAQTTAPTNEPTAPQDPVLANVLDTGGLAAIPSIPSEPTPTPAPTPEPTPVPLLSIDKTVVSVDSTGDGVANKAGDVITYNVVVTNSGNETLTNVTVNDPLTGLNTTIASLAPGASQTFETSYTITQADLDNNGGGDGDIDNTATADSTQTDAVTDSADVPLTINPLLSIDKTVVSVDSTGDGVANKAGDVITYNVVVTNSGNETLTNVTVNDPLTGLNTTIASLAPGASQTFETSYTITQADLDNNGGGDGDIDNTATADSTQTDAVTDSADVPLTINPLLSIDKTVVSVDSTGDGVANKAGDVITYNVVVTNSGNETLTNVTVNDPLTGLNTTIASLAPGASQTFETSYTITQADLDNNGGGDGDIDNTATADSTQTDAVTDSADVPLTINPLLSIDKTVVSVDSTGDGVANKAGDVITYNVVVTNSGNETLTNVTVNDPLTGLNTTIASLAPGASQTFETSYTITQADLDNNGGGDGDIDNTATADSTQTDAVTDSADVPLTINPLLSIDKTVVSVDSTGDGVANKAGDVITYNVVVTNSGNETLTNVTVNDPLTGLNTTIASLAPGASQTFETSYTITQADLDNNGGGDGDIDNTATADSTQTDAVTDSADVPLTINPLLSIDKTVVSVDSTGDGVANKAGDVITYNVVVTNSGNETLTNVTVNDPLTGLNTTIASLAPGASQTFETSYTITQADLDNNGGGDGDIDNTATADSTQTDAVTDSADVPLTINPLLSIDKTVVSVDSTGDGVANKAGDVITYNVVVTNSGNETLTNVTVNDPLTGLNTTIASLAPGASQTFETSYTITQADLDNNGGGDGDIDNTATADSTQTDAVTDSADVPLTINPLLSIDKTVVSVDSTGDGVANKAGDVITYNVVVTNSGNETLTNVTVNDPLTGLNTTIASLAPGASQTFETSYTITQADLDNNGGGDGDIDNTATADSTQTDAVTDSADVPLTINPLLSIDKTVVSVDSTGDGVANKAGDVITYNVVVTNSGNETLTNVTVNDPLTGLNTTIASLAPGASQTFETSYTITQADLDNNGGGDGDIDNTATADSTQTDAVTDSADVPLTINPLLSIDKTVVSVDSTGDGVANKAGDVITYNVVVTNSGNETLTNVTVNDPLTGLNTTIASLAPGASQTFETSYTITQADLDNNGGGDGDIDNTATADSTQTDAVTDSADVPLTINPLLSIDKTVVSVDSTGDGVANKAGDVITYNVVVTNSGNETLTNVTVNDPLTGLNTTIASLAPGASQTFETSYTITQADLDNNGGGDGDIDNTATADSTQTDAVTDSADVPLTINPLLSIDKTVVSVDSTGDGVANKAGDVITYNVVVTNSGNETLTNVTVNDPLTGLNTTIASLAPGASQTFETSYTITQADLDNNGGGDGDIDNTATADSTQTDAVTDSADVPLTINPLLSIDKTVVSVDSTGDGVANKAGDVITYNVVVTNSGNETLTNVTVNDPLTGLNTTIASLAPGASQTFETSYTITQADLDNNGGGDGDIDNTATADSTQTDAVTDSADVPLTINPLLSIDKTVVSVDSTGDGVANKAGDVITYNVVVTNSGNETLTNVTVNDPLTGLNTTIASLAPGASQTFETSYTITQADLDNNGGGDGDIDNTATADSTQTDAVTDSADVPLTINPLLSIDKTVVSVDSTGDGVANKAGDVITYNVVVTNSGNETLTNVTVNDPLTGLNTTIASLAPGASQTFETSYTITQADLDNNGGGDGDIDNTATADSTQTDAVTDSADVPLTINPLLSIDKTVVSVDSTGDGVANKAGDVITYNVVVTNSGNETLTNVTVNDPLTGLNTTIASLAPGASQTFETSYTITQADLDNNGGGDGDIDNTATADSTQTDAVTDSADVPLTINPLLSIDKTVVSVDSTGDGVANKAGDVITYNVVVTNSGNETLTNVTVNDPLTGLNTTIASLAPGASQTFETSYTITQADLDNNGGGDGDIDNTATADSTQTDAVTDSADVPLTINPLLSIDKTVVSVDSTGDGVANKAGDVITYNVVVTNSGNETLTNVTVNDPLTGLNTTIASLAPGASQTFETSYTITQADLDNNGGGDGDIDNTATADSTQTDAVTDSADVPLTINPLLSIDKTVVSVDSTGDGVANKAGDVITYNVVVTNSGNETLTNVTVNDPLTGLNTTIASLAPGASQTFETSYTITQADLDNNGGGDGDIDNTATADSTQTDAVTDSADVPLTINPLLSIDKTVVSVDSTGDGVANKAGDVITYNVVVTNSGNETLTNVTVNDPLTGLNTTIASLAPGASQTFETSYTITQADLDNNGGGDGDIDNTATADSTQTDAVTDSADVPLTINPLLSIDKTVVSVDSTGDGVANKAGDVITYNVVVTNSGNETLTNVTVNDPLTGLNTTIASLAPGASQTFETSYTITQADLDNNGGGDGDIDNTATADSTQTDAVTDSADVPLTINPLLSIDKTVVSVDSTGDGVANKAGDVITYNVVVTNSGNETLTNVTVNDPLTGLNTTIASLAPGASQTFETSYTITQADLDNNGGGDGDIDNTATADSTQTDAVTDSADVPLTINPLLSIDKTVVSVDSTGDGVANKAGDVITYNVVVTNSGNETLTNVTVNDPLTGLNTTIASLAPGASQTFETSYTITQADLDNNGGGDGDIDNTATADSTQTDAVTDSADVPLTINPLLSIDKTVVSVDSTGDGVANKAGDVITYNVVVTNSGNETLTNVTVNDPLTGLNTTIASLAPGASQTFETSYTITQADLDNNGGGDGDIDNTATADSTQTDAVTDSADVPLTINPLLSIDKTVVSVDSTGDGVANKAGDVITYNVVVTNSGNETLTNVTVNDPLTGLNTTIASLAPGASQTFETSYTITQADLDNNGGGDGDIDNTATADSTQTDAVTDSADVPLTINPLLSIDKTVVSVDSTGDGVANKAGDVITYNVVVTNSGNETLTNVTVNDPLTGLNTTIASLAPGASQTFETSYTITQADLDNNGGGDGDIDNTATADSTQTDAVTDSADVPLTINPLLSIDKTVVSVDSTGDGVANKAGDVITYNVVVTNSGNETLTNVTVNDPLTGLNTTIASLAPGASQTFETSYTITQADLDNNGGGDGDIDNTATADSTQTDAVTDSADVPLTINPLLSIDKTVVSVDSTGDGVANKAGDVITYNVVVTNSGNETLTNVTVNDPLTGLNTTIASLAPGASQTFETSYTITQADLDNNGGGDGDIDNTATADSTQTDAVTDSADVPLVPVIQSAVDDEGLPGGIVGGVGDIQPPITQGAEKVYAGSLYGSGGFNFASGTQTIGQESVSWSFASGILTAVVDDGARAGTVLFTVQVTDSSYSVTLVDNVLHAVLPGEQLDTTTTTLSYTDSSGIVRDLTIVFNDDSPDPVILTDAPNLLANQKFATTTGTYDTAVGADDQTFSSSFSLIWDNVKTGYQLNQIASTSDSITYLAVDPSKPAVPLFQVVLKGDSYEFTLLDPNPSTSGDISNLLDAFSNNNSPKPVQIVPDTFFDGLFDVAITGYKPASGNKPQQSLDVKISATDLALGSNSTSPGDRVVFDVVEKAASTVTLEKIDLTFSTTAGFKPNTPGSTNYTVMNYRVVYIDSVANPPSTGSFSVAAANSSLSSYPYSLDISGGPAVDYVEVWSTNTNWKLGGVGLSYETTLPPSDYQYDFHIQVVDADGDQQISDTFSVLIDGDGNGSYGQAPIAIDLNRDGVITYHSLHDSPTVFDFNGDGLLEQTAWVGSGDGLLVFDHNHDQAVSDGSEISFAGYHPDATTDLQGLSLAFDTNHDGRFDAADASFADFGVWQDANGNGLTDEGEFRSLQDLGIVQIDLAGDGVSSTAAGGDVVIHGSTTVTYSDGSTALAQDVQFATLPVDGLLDQAQSETTLPVVVDSNHDGVLSIDDSVFAAVGVWADQNGDGFVTADEVTSLHDSGIASIELGAGLVSTIADGYLHLDGSAAVTHDDGSQSPGSDVHLAVLIDQVVADPAVLDSLYASTPDSFIAPHEVTPVTDLGQVVDGFLASEPVTDADLATLSQDIQLTSDVSTHDAFSTTDPTHLDATSSDAAVFDPSHDMAAYDPAQDTTLHDPMHDVIIHDVVV